MSAYSYLLFTSLILSSLFACFLIKSIPKDDIINRQFVRNFLGYFASTCLGFIMLFLLFQGVNSKVLGAVSDICFLASHYFIYLGVCTRISKPRKITTSLFIKGHFIVYAVAQVILNITIDAWDHLFFILNIQFFLWIAALVSLITFFRFYRTGNRGDTLFKVSLTISLVYQTLVPIISIYDKGFDLYFVTSLLGHNLLLMAFMSSVYSICLNEVIAKFHKDSITDAMTGLFNRRYFLEQGNILLSRSNRHEFPISIIICDLDKFKRINDTYGHDIGDKVIVEFGKTLVGLKRKGDVIARIGGEEFALLLPYTVINEARKFAERLRLATEHLVINTHIEEIKFTASFGISNAQEHELENSLKQADIALYEAKEKGRNQVCIFTNKGKTLEKEGVVESTVRIVEPISVHMNAIEKVNDDFNDN